MKKTLLLTIASVTGVMASQLYAAGAPQGIGVSPGVRLFPSLAVGVTHSDNYFYSDGNTVSEESAQLLVIEPALLAKLKSSRAEINLGVDAEAGLVDTGSEDDYLDHNVFGNIGYQISSRHLVSASLRRQDDHDPFGFARTEGTAFAGRSLDEYHASIYEAAYRFGAPSARINIEVGYSGVKKDYETNRASTRFLDFDRRGPNAKLLVNISPKTAVYGLVSRAEVEYDDVRVGAAARDATETGYLVGAEWKATAKTTGRVAVGQLERDYDSPLRKDSDGATWVASLDWLPTQRDKISFVTSRRNEESFLDAADAIDTRLAGVTWEHRWTSRISSRLGVDDIDADFEGTIRNDDMLQATAALAYELNRAWSVEGVYRRNERDSSVPIRDYEVNVFTIGLKLAP